MDDAQLASIAILAPLSERDRRRITRDALVERYAAGDTILREGDPGTRLYLIGRGSVAVEREGQGRIATLGAGNFFGELALLEKHGRSATVVALEDVECIIVSAWEFRASLREHPEMALPMLDELIRRIHGTEHES